MLHYVTLRFIMLHYVILRDIMLHYVALRYIPTSLTVKLFH